MAYLLYHARNGLLRLVCPLGKDRHQQQPSEGPRLRSAGRGREAPQRLEPQPPPPLTKRAWTQQALLPGFHIQPP